LVTLEGLRRRPDMMRQIRGTVGKVIRIEEGKWVDQRSSSGDRYEEKDNWMAGGSISIQCEGTS
jgi:hypothetical protein